MTGTEFKNKLIDRGCISGKQGSTLVNVMYYYLYELSLNNIPIKIYVDESTDKIQFVETGDTGAVFNWSRVCNCDEFVNVYMKFLKEYSVKQKLKEIKKDFE